jgi:hypothetical protein
VRKTGEPQKVLREKAKSEYNVAVNYVSQTLRHTLEEDPDLKVSLPKNTILNLFVRWNEELGQQLEGASLSLIQMALTSQLKKHFPHMLYNLRAYRGIRFRQEFRHLLNLGAIRPHEGE